MKLIPSWLKDHLETSASLGEIVETLTRIGLEVEHVEDPGEKLNGFLVARVVEAKLHPNADRLQVCMVDTGSGMPVQVVCGAPNARTGMKSVFSPPGTYIPGKKLKLGKGVIRGVESNGMLCSAAELELSADHQGIIDLPADAPVGARYVDYAGLEPVIEINLTPNRPDAAGVHGIARDLAAAGLGHLKEHRLAAVEGRFAAPLSVRLDFPEEDSHLAPLFVLRCVRGVENGPSPQWLQKRLMAIGLRPINRLVDITNYLTFDRGRPLHVFDAKKIAGNLVVRQARAGERLPALDGKTYELDETMVVIADDNGVQSLAGVIGGQPSGCEDDTTDVLIESALWDPPNIAQTGRRLGIASDARYRFERGVDPAFCLPGAELATHFVLDLCGGEASELVIAGTLPVPETVIDFPWSEVRRLTGLDLDVSMMAAILDRLGFASLARAGNADRVFVRVPSWRPDVVAKVDLVEEIVRIAGVDRIVSSPMAREDISVAQPLLTVLQKRTWRARRALAAAGLVEAVTWSFIAKDHAEMFGGGDPELALANPIAADLSDMRPSLLPGLIAAAQRNADRGLRDAALFEVGQIFRGRGDKDQRIAAAAVRHGTAKRTGAGRHWSAPATPVDVFDAKADALGLLDALNVAQASVELVPGGPAWAHPGRSATLRFGPKKILGAFGELHPRVLDALGAQGPLVVSEIVLDELPLPRAKPTKVKEKLELSEFMPVERDFAFLVDRSVKAADLVKAATAADRLLVTDVRVFDVYEGQGIPEGKKSIALAVTLQPRERTLTDLEIAAVAEKVIAAAMRKTGAELRR